MVRCRRNNIFFVFALSATSLIWPHGELRAQRAADRSGLQAGASSGAGRLPGNRSPECDISDWRTPGTLIEDGQALALQTALERSGFSPGILDGIVGPKTRAGLRAFQANAGLHPSGELDAPTTTALRIDSIPVTRAYILTWGDERTVGTCPTNWIEKSRMDYLGFESLAAVAAYKGHCSQALLQKLNHGVDLRNLEPGDTVVLPNVGCEVPANTVSAIEIDFATKTLRVYDRAGRMQALFHCSIAEKKSQRPSGTCTVKLVTRDPEYTFKPSSWPEVKYVKQVLTIPPGPRNPVGLRWIGLSKKGYGVHGTPTPELIGKTGSHGCVRLTNWDALRLAKMVRIGARVSFVDSGRKLASAD